MSIIGKIRSLFQPPPREREAPTGPTPALITNSNANNMLNTIAISTDVETLFLIDNGKAIPFSLTEGRGIIIGLLEDQLTVVSAVRPPIMTEEKDPMIEVRQSAVMRSEVTERDRKMKVVRLSLADSVWATAFDPRNGTLCFIGATEVEVRRPDPNDEKQELEYKPAVEFFNLRLESIHLRRTKDYLIAISLPRKA
jgi:hypothetical protein